MTTFTFYFVFLASSCSELRGGEDVPPTPHSNLEDPLQLGFLQKDFVYSTHRIGSDESEKRAALTKMQLYKTPLQKTDESNICCFEIKDRNLIISPANFLRWRLTSSNFFWGTECSLDDHTSGIFRIPMRIMKKSAELRNTKPPFIEEWSSIDNFLGGDPVVADMAFFYWFFENEKKIIKNEKWDNPTYSPVSRPRWHEDRGRSRTLYELLESRMSRSGYHKFRRILPEMDVEKTNTICIGSARAYFVGDRGWFRGTQGVYFDFVTLKDNKSINLFILIDKCHLNCSVLDHQDVKTNIIEVWRCHKSCEDAHFEDGTFNGEKPLPRVPHKPEQRFNCLIATDLSEPFYVFEKSESYFFLSRSGKIYVSPPPPVADPKITDHLIAELDSTSFSTREKASRDLRKIGKPAYPALEGHLSKPITLEQRQRIKQLLDVIKQSPDRTSRLLWKDEKRPVEKLLFDQDKNKVYAFTKPNKEKQVYYFEIADKPQPRLYTGNPNPDKPSSVPASTRTFLEYARFVRSKK